MAIPHLLDALESDEPQSETKANLSRLVFVFKSIERLDLVKAVYFQSRYDSGSPHLVSRSGDILSVLQS